MCPRVRIFVNTRTGMNLTPGFSGFFTLNLDANDTCLSSALCYTCLGSQKKHLQHFNGADGTTFNYSTPGYADRY